MNNYRETLLSQYANSPTITALLDGFNNAIDPSADIDSFYEVVWNVATAQGFGLDIWGKIVNVSRLLQVDQAVTYFGFDEAFTSATASTGVQPFDQAPFYDGPLPTQTYELSDTAYRQLILLKAMANISDCTAPSMNRMLRFIFGDKGRCYVQDTGGMGMRFVFEFNLSPVDAAIILRSGAIARPAGVSLSIILQLDPSTTFGFAEAGGQPFDQGVFLGEGGIIYAS